MTAFMREIFFIVIMIFSPEYGEIPLPTEYASIEKCEQAREQFTGVQTKCMSRLTWDVRTKP